MATRPRLGVVGSANVDFVVRCEHLPRPGETVLGGDVTRLPGGKGANQAVAASRLGADVSFIGAVGRDEAGDWLLEGLGAHGVDVSRVSRSARPTGVAMITVAEGGQNQIVVAAGANRDLDLSAVDLESFEVVLCQLEVDGEVVAETARRAARLVLNVAPAVAVDPAALRAAEVVIANETEAEALDLRELRHCVVTLGARGAVRLERGWEVARALPPPVEPVDTVGAGDVFSAAYALQCALGADADEALRYAVVAGSLATQSRGAQGALPTDEEVRQWLHGGS